MTSGRKVTTAPPRRDDEIERRWRPVSARVPRLMAVLVRLLGLLTIASVLLPEQRARIRFLAQAVGIPVLASATAAASATIFGVVLLVLAGGLRRRKRRAWRATVLVTLALVLSHLLRGLDVEDAAVSAGILIALIVTREQFYAVGDPTTRWWHAVATPLRILLIGLAAGMIAFAVRPELLLGKPSLWQELQQLLLGLVGVSGPLRFSSDRANDIVGATSIGFGAVFILVAVYLAFRCAAPRAALTPDDEERLRALLTAQGSRDSLGYFALRRDKSVVWSGSGKAAVLYRVVSGVALASGDPIGDPEAWPGAIDVFLDLARRHAWVPAVVGCSEQGATVYDRHGLDALELGDEAIVDTAAFSLRGRAMRGVRQAVNRTERAGYDVTIRRVRDIDPAELAGLARTASAWRGGDVERGFSMALSRLGDPADGDCVVVEAVREGTVRGLLQFAPWGDDGLSLDLMRRDRSADNGVSELMIVRLLEAGPDLRVRRVSLNFAAFRSALERGERIGAGPVLRLWRHALRFASRWWQIESLYRFNLKFQPEWQPRFLSFPLSRDLPRIAFAALEAEAFFVRPRRLQRALQREAER